jgi:chromosome segregation ATPase
MVNKKEKKSGAIRARGRRPAIARKEQEGAACPEELNMPRQSREEYVAGVLEQIGGFEEKLADLESDMESAGWDSVGDYRGQLDDIRSRLKEARAKSEELETAADSAWPSVFEEMEETLLEVAGRVEDLARVLGLVLPE